MKGILNANENANANANGIEISIYVSDWDVYEGRDVSVQHVVELQTGVGT